MVAGSSNDEPRQRDMQHEIRDMISTLTGHQMSIGRSMARPDAKGQETGDNGYGFITLAGNNKGATMKANMEELMDTHGGLYDEDSGMGTYANSNYQAVNNSIVLGGSCTAKDPGVHVVISEHIEDDDDDDEHEKHGKKEEKEKKKKEEEKKKMKKKKKKKDDDDDHDDDEEEEKKMKKEKDQEEEKEKSKGGNKDELEVPTYIALSP